MNTMPVRFREVEERAQKRSETHFSPAILQFDGQGFK
jgi:hypothetical protein